MILSLTPEKLLATTHWSPLSGVPVAPANYHTVAYELSTDGDAALVTLTQDSNASEEEKSHSEANWKSVLEGLKNVVET